MFLLSNLRTATSSLTPYLLYLLLAATPGTLLFGYHLAELNAPQDVITCKRKSIRTSSVNLPQCIPMDSLHLGLVSSIYTLGGLIGALASGPVTSRYGRLLPMRVNTIISLIGAACEALAPSIALMSVGRFISGLSAGSSTVIVPLYISEVAPPTQRGFFGAFTQIATNMGIFLTQLLGYFLSHGQMWRFILAAAGIVGLLQFAALLFAVESPKWAAEHGQQREAKLNLQRIRGEQADISDEVEGFKDDEEDGPTSPDEEQTLLAHSPSDDLPPTTTSPPKTPLSHQQQQQPITILQALSPFYLPATISVIVIMTAQQLTGINSIIIYGVSVLSTLLSSSSALLNICVSVLNIVVTTACAPLSDLLGRKTVLLASIGAMGASSLLLGIGIRTAAKALSAVAVLLFVASFGVALGPVPFILASELAGPEASGALQSWALASNWISTFVVAQFFPILNEKLGGGTVYFGFAVMAVLFAAFIAWWVPETKGRKDADEVWGRTSRRQD